MVHVSVTTIYMGWYCIPTQSKGLSYAENGGLMIIKR